MKLTLRAPGSRRTTGQALVEFALVFPIFLLLVVALFDVGRAVFIYSGLTNAAREGARLAIVNQNEDEILARAQKHAFATVLTTTSAEVVSYWRELPYTSNVDGSDPNLPGPNEPCDGSVAHPLARGCIAVVEVDTTWTPIAPIIGNILGPIALSARSQLPIEFVCPNRTYDTLGRDCPKEP